MYRIVFWNGFADEVHTYSAIGAKGSNNKKRKMKAKPTYQELEEQIAELKKQVEAGRQNSFVQNEEHTQQNNELIRSIMQCPKGMNIFSLDLNYCYTSFTFSHKETMKSIWGVDIEEGMNMLDMIKKDGDREKAKHNFDRTLRGEHFILIEDYGADELLRTWWENRYSPIYSDTNTIEGLTVFVTDITERKQAEMEIKRMAELLTLAPNPITVCDYNGNFLYANQKALDIYGYTWEEFKAIPLSKLDTAESAAQAPARLKEIAKKGEARFQTDSIKKDGSIVTMEVFVKTTKWDDVDAFITISNDVTERKRLEETQQIILEISQLSFKHNSLNSFMTAIHQIINRVVRANNLYLALYDKISNTYSFPFHEDEFDDFKIGQSYNLSNGYTDLVRKSGKAIINRGKIDQESDKNEEVKGYGEVPSVWFGLPVMSSDRNEIIGVIAVQDYHNFNAYAETEQATMEIIADKIGVYIERVKTLESLKKAKEKAEESEYKYRNILDTLSEAVSLNEIIYDNNGEMIDYRIIDANKAFYADTGLTKEQTINKTATQLYGLSSEYIHSFWKKHVNLNETVYSEMYDPDNKKYSYISTSPIVNHQFVTAFFDITERKRIENESIIAREKAEKSEAIYLKLFSEIPDGVYKSTHEGRFIDVNPAMVSMLGYSSKEELLKVDIKNDLYFSASDRENLTLDHVQKKLDVFRMRRKDGSEIWVEDHGWYTFDNQGNILYHEGVLRDVTERIRSEQELFAAKNKAEESDRLKSAFLANMSHEIRTPMNGILGFTSLLKEPDFSGDEKEKFIEIIEKSGARMLGTINDIIDISKIESGQIKVVLSDVNLNNQLDDLYEFFLPEAQKKNIKLSITNKLPNDHSTIKTDKEKLNSILTNFIKNAIKYTHSGSIKLGCSIHKKLGQDELEFYVKDTGTGISKEKQAAVFNRFEQVDIASSQVYEGSGLGLAISKAYVEMLGGQIGLESEEGIGSRFYFTIPFKKIEK